MTSKDFQFHLNDTNNQIKLICNEIYCGLYQITHIRVNVNCSLIWDEQQIGTFQNNEWIPISSLAAFTFPNRFDVDIYKTDRTKYKDLFVAISIKFIKCREQYKYPLLNLIKNTIFIINVPIQPNIKYQVCVYHYLNQLKTIKLSIVVYGL